MEEITQNRLDRLNEALPIMMQELISLAEKNKIDLAYKTADVVLNEIEMVIDFASRALDGTKDRSAP